MPRNTQAAQPGPDEGTGRPAAPPGGGTGQSAPRQRRGGQQLSDEEMRLAEAELDAVREQLLRAPVEVVVANHAMGLWELAALHLSQQPPGLSEARLAIDAMSAMLDGVTGRLGEAERSLGEGLAQLQMAFVQIANSPGRPATPGT